MIHIQSLTWTLVLLAATCPVTAFAQEAAASTPAANALTAQQKQTLQQVAQAAEADAKTQAAALALKAVPIVKEIDRNLLSDAVNEELDHKLSAELSQTIADLVRVAIQAKLRAAHDMAKALTPAQKKALLAEIEKPGANPDLGELIPKVFGDQKK